MTRVSINVEVLGTFAIHADDRAATRIVNAVTVLTAE
jgi:hypothetical protein